MEAWASPEKQIEKVSAFLELYGDDEGFRGSDIPAPPEDFRPRTSTELLLLTVELPDGRVPSCQRTFEAWWRFLTLPEGCTKSRQSGQDISRLLEVAKPSNYPGEIRWVGFDPFVSMGMSPREAQDYARFLQDSEGHVYPAGPEVLMAAALSPKWLEAIRSHGPHLHLAGYNCFPAWLGRTHSVAYLRWESSRLRFGVHSIHKKDPGWSSPMVRWLGL